MIVTKMRHVLLMLLRRQILAAPAIRGTLEMERTVKIIMSVQTLLIYGPIIAIRMQTALIQTGPSSVSAANGGMKELARQVHAKP